MLRFIDKRELSVCLLPCTRRDQLGQPKQFISLPTHNKTQNETIRYVLSTFFHLYLSTFFRPRLVLHLRVIVWIDAPVCFIIGKDLAICPSVSFADNLIIQLHYRSTLVTTFFFYPACKAFFLGFFHIFRQFVERRNVLFKLPTCCVLHTCDVTCPRKMMQRAPSGQSYFTWYSNFRFIPAKLFNASNNLQHKFLLTNLPNQLENWTDNLGGSEGSYNIHE